MKKSFMFIGILLLLLAAMPAFAVDSFLSKTGLNYWDASRAYNGYTLFTSIAAKGPLLGATYLIDMEGNVVHKWLMPEDHVITTYAYLLPNGNLLRGITSGHVQGGTLPPGGGAVTGAGTKYQEVDWNGNVIWEARHPNHRDITWAEFQQITGLTDAQMNDEAAKTAANTTYSIAISSKFDRSEHHDFKKVFNKKLGKDTIMFVNNRYIPEADVLKLGVHPANVIKFPTYPKGGQSDCISEVDIQTGQLVWDWCFQDHFIQNFDPSAQNYSVNIANQSYGGDIEEAFYRRFDVNMKNNQGGVGLFLQNSTNAMDYNADRDEVVFSNRNTSEFYVVDHNTTTAEAKGKKGDFLYRFGSPYNYASDDQLGAGKGKAKFPSYFSAELTQLWGAHNPHWIPTGRPGAGHFLVFDNGTGRVTGGTYSAVLQINPYDASGKYVKELAAGHGGAVYPSGYTGRYQTFSTANQTMIKLSKQIVWGFSASPGALYSSLVSGAERLPNGNTLITGGMHGHMFEVTSAGNLVWEYRSPLMSGDYITDTLGLDKNGVPIIGGPGVGISQLFRSYRYAPDFPGLAGKSLINEGPIGHPATYYGFGFDSEGTTSGFGGATGAGGTGGASGGY